MKLKFAPFCSSRDALSDGIIVGRYIVHLNGRTNLRTKTYSMPKLKELQCPKIRLMQPLLGVIPTPNFMQIC